MTGTPTLAARLAEYAAELEYDDLDDATVARAKDRILDALGCAYAGVGTAPVRTAVAYAARRDGDRSASVVGGGTSSVEAAAFANGVAIRYVDWNDTYLSVEPGHPSDNIGAVLAVADAHGCSGRDAILATVLAYELQCRLGDAASLRANGFDHVNYGLVSATLAAAKLMDLGREEMTQAVNVALTGHLAMRQARAGELTEWKGMAFGNVDRNAVVAAELAADGIEGPAPVFEGTFGFFNLVTGEFDLAVDGFGGRDGEFRIHRTLVKHYPVEVHAQAAVDCAFALRDEHGIDAADVERIENETYEAGVSIIGEEPEKWRPRTRETADHSMPYCIARAFLDGEMTLAQFSEEKYTDPDAIELMDAVEIEENEAYTERYGEALPHRMVVHTADATYEHEVEHPRGHYENPLSERERKEKFATCLAGAVDDRRRDAILDAVGRLDGLSDLSPLVDRL